MGERGEGLEELEEHMVPRPGRHQSEQGTVDRQEVRDVYLHWAVIGSQLTVAHPGGGSVSALLRSGEGSWWGLFIM